jgi:TnpA family transposase
LVEQQYDAIVPYTTAMAERTADPEATVHRFTRGNIHHPAAAMVLP